jgi:hypothetical protein
VPCGVFGFFRVFCFLAAFDFEKTLKNQKKKKSNGKTENQTEFFFKFEFGTHTELLSRPYP